MSKSLYREYAWQRREQDIVNAAGKLMREKDYESLTMDELAKELDISKPTLYQHFKTKDELVTQVFIQAMQILEEHLSASQQKSPLEILKRVLRMLLETRYRSDTVLGAIGLETIDHLAHNHPIVREHKERVGQQMRRLIDEAKARGEIVSSIPTFVIARTIFCLLRVPLNPQGEDVPPFVAAVSPQEVIDGIVRLVLSGITPTPIE
jgi:TetR/AcrR family transcriptional regulator, cholesterol catabolism regulator